MGATNSHCQIVNGLNEPVCLLVFGNADLCYDETYTATIISPHCQKIITATADALGLKFCVVNFSKSVYFARNGNVVHLGENGVVNGAKEVGETKIWNKKELNDITRTKCRVHNRTQELLFIATFSNSDCIYATTFAVFPLRPDAEGMIYAPGDPLNRLKFCVLNYNSNVYYARSGDLINVNIDGEITGAQQVCTTTGGAITTTIRNREERSDPTKTHCKIRNNMNEHACVFTFNNADLIYAIENSAYCIPINTERTVFAAADVFGLKVMIANCGRQVYFVEDKGKITINPDYTVTGGELIGEAPYREPGAGAAYCRVRNFTPENVCILTFNNADIVYSHTKAFFNINANTEERVTAASDLFGLKVVIPSLGRDVYFVDNGGVLTLNPDRSVSGGDITGKIPIQNYEQYYDHARPVAWDMIPERSDAQSEELEEPQSSTHAIGAAQVVDL